MKRLKDDLEHELKLDDRVLIKSGWIDGRVYEWIEHRFYKFGKNGGILVFPYGESSCTYNGRNYILAYDWKVCRVCK